ncbi:MAG: GntR family transcriptional regulator [Chloroflexi bacterium]|nr:GntR family transcriptional regulator [Chloroflexota bacterium]
MKKNSALSAEVFTVLKERIIYWDYSPDHRFTEEELCEEFGVSRSPVREALNMLVENGLVIKEPYRSYRVRQPDLEEIHNLYDVRLALELFTVEWLATQGMSDTEWGALHETWQSILNQLPKNAADFAEKDESFHEKLADCTGNQVLAQYLRHIDERLHFVRLTDITTQARIQATCEQHLKILECIKNKNVQCAREAMRQNIESGRQNVEGPIKEALVRSFQIVSGRK